MSEPAVQRPISVLLVDDHPVVREGLKMLIAGAGDMVVAGESSTAADAVAVAAEVRPDLVLLDLTLGTDDGIRIVPQLIVASPSSRILVLTGIQDQVKHQAAVLAGARGLIMKDRPPELLLKAVRKVHAGELWFDRQLLDVTLQRAVSAGREAARSADVAASLTGRELDIVKRIAKGLRNADIAAELGITPKTVRNHLSTIYDKLGVADRLELLVFSYDNGIVSRS